MWVRGIEDISGGREDLRAWVGVQVPVSAAVPLGGGVGHGISGLCAGRAVRPQ